MNEYTETTTEVARQTGPGGPTAATVRRYADMGLLDFVWCSNGTRLFRAGQADRVRKIHAQRMGLRGRRRREVQTGPAGA